MDKSRSLYPCSPQSQQCRTSLLPLPSPLPLTWFPVPPLSLSPCQSGLLPLVPFIPPFWPPWSLVPLVNSSAPFPECHVPDPFGPLPASRPFQAIAHVSSRDMSLFASWSLCIIHVLHIPKYTRSHWHWSVVGHPVVDDLQLLHVKRPIRNSRPISFGITSLTTNVF